MTPKRHTLVAAVTLAMLLLTSGIGLASPAATSQPAAIKLKAATFTPGRGEKPALRAGLAAAAAAEGKNAYYLVQFSGPVEQAWKDQVTAAGAELLDYVPDFTFKVRATPAIARQIEQLSNVAFVGLFHPAYKLSPELKRDGVNIFKVRIERGADAAAAAAAIGQSGVQVLGRDKDIVLIAAEGAKLDAIAQVLDVAWVQNFVVFEKHNQYGGGAIMGANIANASGYDGSTQIAAVADTGIGGGTATTAHRDIPSSRVQAIQNFPGASGGCFQSIIDDGSVDVDSGHGTHVAGSVLSGGGLSGEGKGVAPAAKLVFQSIENYAVVAGICAALYGYTDGYYLTGIPDDLNTLFQQAYNAGARIHSNSWGSAAAGDYTLDSSNADKFVWNNRDMVITFSAGNEGIDANSDGVVDNDSIGSPATAKNVITIGASENDRQGNYQCDTSLTYTSHDATYQSGQTCGSMSGQNLLGTYGQRWGADYPANPIASDPTAGNQEQLASFSSRGPTDDGRIKPDVVAPGTWILSTYSSQYQEGYGDPVNPRTGAYQSDGWGIAYNEYYKYFGGTSMSNPLAGGAATVVRDYYNKAKSYTTPSAALIKATLINSAVDLLDENNDGVNDNDYPIPNNFEGWGRINVANATDGSIQYLDQKTGLATNGVSTSQVNVTTSGPLKLTVVWSDYQSTETATANLVNDLDLVVTSPSGAIYRGNVFSGGWSATGGTADRKNNVESVYIQSAATGNWTVEVKGFNVPNGPQPFALVADGGALSTVTPTPPAAPASLTATAVSRSQINLSWGNVTGETGFKIERCAGSTCTNFAQIATVGADVTTFSNTGLSRSTTYRYRVRATNAGGDSAYSNIATATTPRN